MTNLDGALLTFEEASALTKLSEDELRMRIDPNKLVVQTMPGGEPREVIPRYALTAIDQLPVALTLQERQIERLIERLRRRRPLSTHDASITSGLNRQAAAVALMTLRMRGLVSRSKEPLPNGAGGHRDVWRWIGD
jgi:hypothetical protein